jgi:hypothetical protein
VRNEHSSASKGVTVKMFSDDTVLIIVLLVLILLAVTGHLHL